jgi:hypothetical protein
MAIQLSETPRPRFLKSNKNIPEKPRRPTNGFLRMKQYRFQETFSLTKLARHPLQLRHRPATPS